MKQKTLAFVLIASVLMSACGGAAKTPAVPPTATPIPPTATPAPKPVAASGGDITQVLAEAYSKTYAAKSYSETFMLTGKGAVLGLPGEASDNEERVLMNQTSQVNGANRSTEIGGTMTQMMSSTTGVAYLTVDGTIYVKGPAQQLGAPEAKWYAVPAERVGTIRLPLQATDFFKTWTVEHDIAKNLKLTVTVEMDGQSCQVYAANQEELLKSKGTFAANISKVDTAEAHVTICADGYVHELNTSIGGKLKSDLTKRGLFSMNIRLSDFGKTFAFEAPKSPNPLMPRTSAQQTMA
jgi:hypothetical protein